jgi:hypothetical protein
MADKPIDFSRYRESEEVSRQLNPERIRPQTEREREPDYFQRSREREGGGSDFSGSKWGGGIWNGRSR